MKLSRLPFIDNLRWIMIMLVLSMHAAVTYSSRGGWYYKEPARLSQAEVFTFVTYQAFLQSFFMGLLFFVAGYFVPAAYDKKGPRQFLKDRAFRLGLPVLLYMLVIGPLTEHYLYHEWSFSPGGSGPLWFCLALLAFCCVYALWRVLFSRKPVDSPRPFPRTGTVILFILSIALATFLIRIPYPNGTSWFNMQFCYFPQYIAFFIAGTIAYRHSWLTTLARKTGRSWGLAGLIGGFCFWLILLIFGGAFTGKAQYFSGGWHLQSLGLSVWEALAGVGLSLGCLILLKEKYNHQGRLAAFFSKNAFAVYVIHPPVLIALTLLMRSMLQPPLLKFLLATTLCIIAAYVLAAALRKIPYLKEIL